MYAKGESWQHSIHPQKVLEVSQALSQGFI